MKLAMRGNKVVQIADGDIQRYLSQGFSIVNENGDILEEAIPSDYDTMSVLVDKQKQSIKSLRSENESLKAEVSKLQEELNALASQSAKASTAKRTRKSSTTETAETETE